MRTLFVAFIISGVIAAVADDLADLKVASVRFVAAMKAALALSDDSDCSDTIAKAGDYAAAKVAYYDAARRAVPRLLQIAKGEKTDSRYGEALTEIFRGFGEDKDEETTGILEAKLYRCPTSDKRDQAQISVEQAQQTAEQFVKEFGGFEGI